MDSGRITYDGMDVGSLRGAALRRFNRRVQMVFQDPYGSLNPRMTVRATLAEALSVHRMCPRREMPARIAALMDLVNLPRSAAGRRPHEFSGGQRQRIGIARALALEPDCLIADELVSALDVSVQAQMVNLLLELQERLHLTVLFIAHDLRLVRHLSHRVAVMYLGAHRGAGRDRGAVRTAAPPLHARAAGGGAGARPGAAGTRGGRRERRVAEPGQSASRLRVSPALPGGDRAVPDRTASPGTAAGRQADRLPCGGCRGWPGRGLNAADCRYPTALLCLGRDREC